ncbi:MAG: glycosyltransferase family 4 protein [Bacteroides faecis]|uniref:Glycosyltransferase EpsF n=1 Tax=Bacteroides faecis TaxID=674529 RepID=A0A6N2XBP4_9BACE|nr:glycosyltransferase family 4 protein [Bacteroides faecis]MCS2235475.1 glycosyltransferase family 4 protein [Bacteroides faecis]MCY6310810.1 glycosyltransferase family 4 protein [Bacteroides faecis]
MKIVHILASLGSGGIQGFVFSLACQQSRLGHDVMVIATDVCDNEHSSKQEIIYHQHNVKVHRLNRKRGNKLDLLKTIYGCRKLVSEFKPDIVNTHATLWHMIGALSTVGTSYKQICTVHNTPERWNFVTNMLCKNKPVICCSIPAFENRVQKSSNVICIENGVDATLVRTSEIVDLRREFNLPEDTKVVVSVGNLRPQKNYKNVIELAKHYENTNVHFFICGGNHGGPSYDDPKLYEGYPNLHCLGTRSDVSAIENSADLFLSSSTFEGLPIAVLEAYFNGIPCILSPIPQHINISNVEEVFIPKSFAVSDFIKVIDKALLTKKLHNNIYASREKSLEKYSITGTAILYIDYYNKNL